MGSIDFNFLNRKKKVDTIPNDPDTVTRWWFDEWDGTHQCYYCHRRWRHDTIPVAQKVWYTKSGGTCQFGMEFLSHKKDPKTQERVKSVIVVEIPCRYCLPSKEVDRKLREDKDRFQQIQDDLFYENRKSRKQEKPLPY